MDISAIAWAPCASCDDIVLQGMTNCIKVVDDILLRDEDYLTHLHHISEVLSRCRMHSITLDAEKFVLAAPAVPF